MRPIRVWLSAAVCGFALIVIAGSGPPLQAEEPRERVREDRAPEVKEHREGERVDRERQEREHQTREAEARKHRETEDRDRDDRDHDDRDREAHDRDDDDDEDDDHARPNPHDGDRPHDGPTDVRNSVNDELLDLARALRRIDQSYGFRGIQGCGSWTAGSAYMDWDARGFGNRPHPPMVRDPGLYEDRFYQGAYRDHHTCGGCGRAYPLHGQPSCGCALPPRPLILSGCRDAGGDDDNCSLLTRRICTGCGHVYPRHEQPRCNCHGSEAHHDGHPGPAHGPHHGPDREPTPVDRDHDHDRNHDREPAPVRVQPKR